MNETLRFDRFELDLETGELRREGRPIDLQPQPTRLLLLLARHRGHLVTRERIREELWPDTVVEYDAAINAAVRQARDALGDDARDPRYIETVPRRGYRFAAGRTEVEDERGTKQAAKSTAASAARGRRGPGPGWIAAGMAAALLFAALAWVARRAGMRPDAEFTLAVVPARVLDAGSSAEAFADSLTGALLESLGALDPDRIEAIPWEWTMSYDRERGVVERGGEPLGLDFALDASVYADGGRRVSVSLVRIDDGTQLWHRRFDAGGGRPASAIAEEVSRVVAENLAGAERDPG